MFRISIAMLCFLLAACSPSRQQQFDMLDHNKDGFVTLQEFNKELGVETSGKNMMVKENEDVAKTLFTSMDENQDGQLTSKEYDEGLSKGSRRRAQ